MIGRTTERHWRVFSSLLVCSILLGGCALLDPTDSCVGIQEGTSMESIEWPAGKSGSAASAKYWHPLGAVAGAIPGFGGYFFDEPDMKGYLNIYLLQPDQELAEQARARIAGMHTGPNQSAIASVPVRPVQGQYAFSQLGDWYLALVQRMSHEAVPEFHTGGIAVDRNRVYIGLDSIEGREKVLGILKGLDIPGEAFYFVVEDRPVKLLKPGDCR
jgi:hypothetical protein